MTGTALPRALKLIIEARTKLEELRDATGVDTSWDDLQEAIQQLEAAETVLLNKQSLEQTNPHHPSTPRARRLRR